MKEFDKKSKWLYKGEESKLFESKDIKSAEVSGWLDCPTKAKNASKPKLKSKVAAKTIPKEV